MECGAVISRESDFAVYESRRVLFGLFVDIPLTTPGIDFVISECHRGFGVDLIIVFSAERGILKKIPLDHTDPLREPFWRG